MQSSEIQMERYPARVQVIVEGETIADTTSALKMSEPGYDPVFYIPKNDIKEIDLLKCADYDSPIKGHAEIYTIRHGAHDIEEAAWCYDEPSSQMQELAGRVAFYPEKVQEIKIGDEYQ